MSKTLRIFFLSVFALMFAVSSAFSEVEVNETDDDTLYTPDEKRIEGYTYTTRFIAEGTVEWNDGDDDISISDPDVTIEWSLSEKDGRDISWLNKRTISNDEVLIIEGIIPDYDEDNDTYNIIATAKATYHYTSHGTPLSEENNGEGYSTLTVLQDENKDKEIIEPTLIKEKTEEWGMFLSSSNPSNDDPLSVSDGYEAHLLFTEEEGDLKVYVTDDYLEDNIILPLWLSYSIEKTTEDEDGTYVTDLKIYYAYRGDNPLPGTKARIGINNANIYDEDERSKTDTDAYVVSWNVVTGELGNAVQIIEGTEVDISVNTGKTGLDTIKYDGNSEPVSWKLTDDKDSVIKQASLGLTVTSDDEAQTITLNVAPTAQEGTYHGKITFTDAEGYTTSVPLTVTVVPPLHIEDTNVKCELKFGQVASTVINYTGAAPVSYKVADDASSALSSSDLGLSVTSDDATITLAVRPITKAGTYTGTITFADANAHEENATLTVVVAPSIYIEDGTSSAISLKCGETSSDKIAYKGLKPEDVEIVDAIDSEISKDVLGFNFTANDAVIEITVSPTEPGTYNGTLYFIDADENRAQVALTVTVAPAINISEDRISITASVNKSTSENLNVRGAVPTRCENNVPPSFNFDVELPNSVPGTIKLSITPTVEDSYTGTLTFYDADGNSDDVEVTLTATEEALPLTVSPAEKEVTVTKGSSTTLDFTVENSLPNSPVTWSYSTLPTGITMSFSPNETSEATATTLTVSADANAVDGEVIIRASQGAGARTDEANEAKLTIKVTEREKLKISPAETPVSVQKGSSSTVTLNADNAVGAITWTKGTLPTGITVDFAANNGTKEAKRMVVTVSSDATNAVSGNVIVTAKDSDTSDQATATLKITVTDVPPVEFTIKPSRQSVTFTSPTASAQTVTFTSSIITGTTRYSVESISPSTGLDAKISESTLTLTPSAANSYVVTVKGTNGTRTTTVDINVKVNNYAPAPGTPEEIDVEDLDEDTQDAIAKVESLKAGGSISVKISIADLDYRAERWMLYINDIFIHEIKPTSYASSSVYASASDWSGSTLSGATSSDVTVNIVAPDTIAEDTPIELRIDATDGNVHAIEMTVSAGSKSTPRLPSSSSSGCSAGFGGLALLAIAPLFLRKKRS